MWLEHVDFGTVEGFAEDALEQKGFFGDASTAEPAVGDLFGFNSYDGGATILHALRLTLGDDAFFDLLARWSHDNLGESRHTEDFVEFANEVTREDLTDFFDEWLFAEEPPEEYPNADVAPSDPAG
jgi:aminopeptidase N